MSFSFTHLDALKAHHPAWRLLRSDHAPLVLAFLHQAFVAPNIRGIKQSDLVECLEDMLFSLRQQSNSDLFPKPALDYLNDWAAPEKGWLRKFYEKGSDEPCFDLMPATEKAIAWLNTLLNRNFVGTESKLLTLFDLLKQICQGSESDPEKRLAELYKQRDKIEHEITQVQAGHIPLLDDVSIKDRFQQFTQLARELLTDLHEVEYNFRQLDRRVRERIALWEGGKGALLEEIMGERDLITDSDQGRSFKAFWDFLLSSDRQESFSTFIAQALTLTPVADLKPDIRTRQIHYDWLKAGEHTQRTVAQLSQQLRRFLDNQLWLENRRIMDILHNIESRVLTFRDNPPVGNFTELDDFSVNIEIPMERPLYTPVLKPNFSEMLMQAGESDISDDALFTQVVIDKTELIRHIRQVLEADVQVTLSKLIALRPLQHGLAELIVYLQLSAETFKSIADETVFETISWITASGNTAPPIKREARLPRITFVRQT